jgi:hypothetical protein
MDESLRYKEVRDGKDSELKDTGRPSGFSEEEITL